MDKIYDILFEIRPENDFRHSKDFIAEALLDSLDIIELVSMLEEEYGIQISPDDIVPENFTNVEEIEKLIGI